MIYITGDTHNTEDMLNLSTKNMKLCCMEQGVDFHNITHVIVLGDFGLPWSSDCEIDEAGIHPADHTDRYLLKWFFGHWHSDWGYENYKESKYIPLYHQGNIIK